LDVIVIRDGFSTAANYVRTGPFGAHGTADAAKQQAYINGVRAFFRETKQANPAAKVIGYSQASSSVGEWRYGMTDVETIVADGWMDAWVDQSWSGAWQDVPTRPTAGLGWTHQLGYILAHRAQIEGGNRKRSTTLPPCKHYVLHDTFDAYEGWDTLRNVPWKLVWGVWAYNHASFLQKNGSLSPPDGQYISWANSWSFVYNNEAQKHSDQHEGSYLDRSLGLLTRTDIAFLTSALNAAVNSAMGLKEVFGPAVVYNRAALETLMAKSPTDNVAEWIDEQVPWLMKFGTPALCTTRIEDGIDPQRKDGYIISIPTAASASDAVVTALKQSSGAGYPLAIVGRADMIHPELLALVGAAASPSLTAAGGGSGNSLIRSSELLLPYYGNGTLTGPAVGGGSNGNGNAGASTEQVLSVGTRARVSVDRAHGVPF
jgi:hypothetical protein